MEAVVTYNEGDHVDAYKKTSNTKNKNTAKRYYF